MAVAIGYSRCPKCHAPMPQAGRARRDTQQGGGTSASAGAAGPPWTWLAVGGAVLGLGAVVWLATRGDGRSHAAAVDEPGEVTEPDQVASAAAPAPPAPPTVPTRRDPHAAAARLERALATQRLYGRAVLRGTQVELRSSFCAEPSLVQLVDAARAELVAEGVSAVICLEPHGAEVFTRPL